MLRAPPTSAPPADPSGAAVARGYEQHSSKVGRRQGASGGAWPFPKGTAALAAPLAPAPTRLGVEDLEQWPDLRSATSRSGPSAPARRVAANGKLPGAAASGAASMATLGGGGTRSDGRGATNAAVLTVLRTIENKVAKVDKLKESLRLCVEAAVARCPELANCGVEVVGSTSWGGAVPESDLDLVLLSPSKEAEGQEAVALLRLLRDSLEELGAEGAEGEGGERLKACPWKHLELLDAPRVPLLRLLDAGGELSCDVSVDRQRALHHRRVLRRDLEGRPEMLGFVRLVKYWLRRRGLPMAGEGGIPSLAWAVAALRLAEEQPQGSSVEVLLLHFFSQMRHLGDYALNIAHDAHGGCEINWRRRPPWTQEWVQLFLVNDPVDVLEEGNLQGQGQAPPGITQPSMPAALGALYVAELRLAWEALDKGRWEDVWRQATAEVRLPLPCVMDLRGRKAPLHILLKDGIVHLGRLQEVRKCPTLQNQEVLHRRDQSSELVLEPCCLVEDGQGPDGPMSIHSTTSSAGSGSHLITCQPCHWICALPTWNVKVLPGDGRDRLQAVTQLVAAAAQADFAAACVGGLAKVALEAYGQRGVATLSVGMSMVPVWMVPMVWPVHIVPPQHVAPGALRLGASPLAYLALRLPCLGPGPGGGGGGGRSRRRLQDAGGKGQSPLRPDPGDAPSLIVDDPAALANADADKATTTVVSPPPLGGASAGVLGAESKTLTPAPAGHEGEVVSSGGGAGLEQGHSDESTRASDSDGDAVARAGSGSRAGSSEGSSASFFGKTSECGPRLCARPESSTSTRASTAAPPPRFALQRREGAAVRHRGGEGSVACLAAARGAVLLGSAFSAWSLEACAAGEAARSHAGPSAKPSAKPSVEPSVKPSTMPLAKPLGNSAGKPQVGFSGKPSLDASSPFAAWADLREELEASLLVGPDVALGTSLAIAPCDAFSAPRSEESPLAVPIADVDRKAFGEVGGIVEGRSRAAEEALIVVAAAKAPPVPSLVVVPVPPGARRACAHAQACARAAAEGGDAAGAGLVALAGASAGPEAKLVAAARGATAAEKWPDLLQRPLAGEGPTGTRQMLKVIYNEAWGLVSAMNFDAPRAYSRASDCSRA